MREWFEDNSTEGLDRRPGWYNWDILKPVLGMIFVVVFCIGVILLGLYANYKTAMCYICRARPCHAVSLVCDDGGTFKVCRKCAGRIRRDYMPKETEQ